MEKMDVPRMMAASRPSPRWRHGAARDTSPKLSLFLASFISLFLELLLIRWVPSQVRVIAYYGNLMLLSSFLGLGCGAMLARRKLHLIRFFAPLLCALVIAIAALKGIRFHQGPDEFRFLFTVGASSTTLPLVV